MKRDLRPARSGLAAWLVAIVLLGLLCACGGQPMAFPAPESEMGDRPGLFTGDSGAWTAYKK